MFPRGRLFFRCSHCWGRGHRGCGRSGRGWTGFVNKRGVAREFIIATAAASEKPREASSPNPQPSFYLPNFGVNQYPQNVKRGCRKLCPSRPSTNFFFCVCFCFYHFDNSHCLCCVPGCLLTLHALTPNVKLFSNFRRSRSRSPPNAYQRQVIDMDMAPKNKNSLPERPGHRSNNFPIPGPMPPELWQSGREERMPNLHIHSTEPGPRPLACEHGDSRSSSSS